MRSLFYAVATFLLGAIAVAQLTPLALAETAARAFEPLTGAEIVSFVMLRFIAYWTMLVGPVLFLIAAVLQAVEDGNARERERVARLR